MKRGDDGATWAQGRVRGIPHVVLTALFYPKDKELSLVADAFLEFSLDVEPRMRENMIELWPELADTLLAAEPAGKIQARSRKS